MNNLRFITPIKQSGSAPLIPSNKSGLQRWFREVYDGTVTDVTQVIDLSGSGDTWHGFSSGGGTDPTIAVGDLNGHDAYVLTDATSGTWGTAPFLLNPYDPAMPFCVGWVTHAGTWQPTTAGYQPQFLLGSTVGPFPFIMYWIDTALLPTFSTITFGIADATTQSFGCPMPTYDSYHTYLLNYNGMGAGTISNYEFYIDDVLQTLTPGATLGTPANRNSIGGGTSSNAGIGENWVEWFLYDSVASAAQVSGLFAYFNGRYAL